MTDQFIQLPGAARTDRISPRAVGSNVGAALFLGHGHADGQPLLLLKRHIARIVDGGCDFGLPKAGQIRLQAQGRHRRERHGNWAAVARLDLRVQESPGRPRHMGARPWDCPRRGVQPVLYRRFHEPVIGRVKIHLIDAVAETIVALIGIGGGS